MGRPHHVPAVALAAALGVPTMAMAGDLPMAGASPVDYVAICDGFGTGFYYIPGTDTCLQLSGYVRVNNIYATPDDRSDDLIAFNGRAQLRFDARTATDLGTLRSFVSINADYLSGPRDGVSSAFVLDQGFLQFGGLTAGFARSTYNFFDNFALTPFLPYFASAATTPQLAYRVLSGEGFWASLSAESNEVRRRYEFDDVGQALPDLVATIGVEQGWGRAQLMGAVHQIRAETNAEGWSTTANAVVKSGAVPDTVYGYAVGAGALLNLPWSTASLLLEATYDKGATSYTAVSFQSVVPTFAPLEAFVVDGEIETATAWSVNGELRFALTPRLSGTLLAGYGEYDPPDNAWNVAEKGFQPSARALSTGASLAFTVVPGLVLSGAAGWLAVDRTANGGSDVPAGSKAEDGDGWLVGLRLQRNF